MDARSFWSAAGPARLADAGLERASAVLGAAVAKAAQVTGAVVVDGGTSAGVMRLTGQARARWPSSLPELVGVAPAGLATTRTCGTPTPIRSATASGTSPPAWPGTPPARPEDQPGLALERRVPHLLAPAMHPASTRMTSTNHPSGTKGGMAGAVGARAHPGTPGDRPRKANRHHARNRAPAQSVTGPQERWTIEAKGACGCGWAATSYLAFANRSLGPHRCKDEALATRIVSMELD